MIWCIPVLRVFRSSTLILIFVSLFTLPAGAQTGDLCDNIISNDIFSVAIEGGDFTMGAENGYPEERPARQITIKPFRLMIHEVTNAQFTAFVTATGYITRAERVPEPALHPEIPKEQLIAGSALFVKPKRQDQYWWQFMPSAAWHAPGGPGTSVDEVLDHPVVHITYEDAASFAAWIGGRLPSEPEWEFAARAGLDRATYEWGETPPHKGDPRANTWQGPFPFTDTGSDGHLGSAPVGSYDANAFGLHDMTGNVWEWVSDNNADANSGWIKGGSFLCADNFCRRYRPAARQSQELDFSTNHIGFRVAFDETFDCRKN